MTYPSETAAIRQIRQHISNQFDHKPHIYFADFFVTLLVGWFFAYLYLSQAGSVAVQSIAYVAAGFALFRAGLFMHEIVHMPKGRMGAFKVVWNVLYGIPMASHSYLYTCHLYHHKSSTFSTADDGEYLSLGRGSKWRIFFYLLEIPIAPLLGLLRFLLLVPLSFISPGVRSWMIRNASSAVMNPRFKLNKLELYDRWWMVCDLASSAWLWLLVALAAYDVIAWQILVKAYFLIVLILAINWLRNLVAHTYTIENGSVSYLTQFLDSINIKGPALIVFLFFPIGMRYHALHHLFPLLPYHALRHVHTKLKAELAPESPYLANTELDTFEALARLLKHSGRTVVWRGVG